MQPVGEAYLKQCRAGVEKRAPDEAVLTGYDHTHMLTYARLLDAERDGHEWSDVAVEVLDLDISADCVGARRCWASHLERAHWLVREGFAT